jgi:hypothetical protein
MRRCNIALVVFIVKVVVQDGPAEAARSGFRPSSEQRVAVDPGQISGIDRSNGGCGGY